MSQVAEAQSLAERVKELIESGKVEPPPLPEVVIRLREVLADPRADVKQLTELVKNEPAVVASLLRFANSAVFGGLRPISDLSQAIARLGMQQVTSLVTAIELKGQFECKDKEHARLLRVLWDHSVATAYFSQRLAERAASDSEQAFLAGLLHDCGRLLIFRAIDVLRDEDPSLEITRPVLDDMMEGLHCELGDRTLRQWNLPEEIAAVAARHEEPPQSDDDPLLTIVQAADAMAQKMGLHLAPDAELDLLEEPSIEMLNLRDIELATLMVDLEDEFNQVRDMF